MIAIPSKTSWNKCLEHQITKSPGESMPKFAK